MVRSHHLAILMCCLLLLLATAYGQSPNATISGLVTDSSGAVIIGADVLLQNDATDIQYSAKTGKDGIYLLSDLPPGTYRLQVSKPGFKTIIKPDIILTVQGALGINFALPIGAVAEVVTVAGGAPLIDTQSAAVSTVVDRHFADNLPMNGRSFQTLIYLTPGVVVTPSNELDGGQFSVNGQRASSNYWMVDGVSANIGTGAAYGPGNGFGGALGSFSALGGTNSLVSVDAMREFRIQTSTYAPEFGRTPGAQISIVTRSGTDQFHGGAFDYVRNDTFDANDWFADQNRLPKPEERQNDFGGTFSGPLQRDRTFFFLSYEGLRLRLPQVATDTVPDLAARQNAIAAMRPYLDAFPLPTAGAFDNPATGIAQFNSSYSNSAKLDAASLRIDHKLTGKWSLFGRYDYSPSDIIERGNPPSALSVVQPDRITTQTATFGGTWSPTADATNDLRFNYSRTRGASYSYLDSFGGAVPIASLPFPTPFSARDSSFQLLVFSLTGQSLSVGRIQEIVQRQYNLVDSIVLERGRHSLKFGVDFRRLSPIYRPRTYLQEPVFFDVSSTASGNPFATLVDSGAGSTLLFHNLGVYAQDTWRASSRLTLTYGLRWDVDFAPSSASGPNLPGVTGYNLNNLSNLALASAGTPPFRTPYRNIAPRLGIAYQLSDNRDWETVLRGGVGVFYDLVSSEAGNLIIAAGYPFTALNEQSGSFPLSTAAAAPPPITPESLSSCCNALAAFDPHLRLPYSLEWNAAVEQEVGDNQSISLSYIGSSGRRLLQTGFVYAPTPNLYAADLVGNMATSVYDALQIQFQRRLSSGLQILAGYTWSHSIDDGSAGSTYLFSNAFVPGLTVNANRGPSDFDIRNAFSVGWTYDFPTPTDNHLMRVVFGGWSTENFFLARSAPPVDVTDGQFGELDNGSLADTRPDLVPGEPLYLYGAQCASTFQALGELGSGSHCAGDKGLNPAAFVSPPVDPNTGRPLRQGTTPRNFLKGFGATQWDFAVHRDFPITESVKLQFRAEMFNILNHPNFGQPDGQFGFGGFGLSRQMLGRSLNASNQGGGALSPLYQIGGPRSIQLALKLIF
jgi:Carboxypeptidase regulatory-like domain/TonB dependent receptor